MSSWRNGWQLDCCTGEPIAARTWAINRPGLERAGDLAEVLIVPRRLGRAVAGGQWVAGHEPADPETVAVHRLSALARLQALVYQRVAVFAEHNDPTLVAPPMYAIHLHMIEPF